MRESAWRELMLERGPVGRWRSALGTAAALVGEEVVFAADGTGLLRSYSALFGEDEPLAFRWRMEGRAQVRILLVGPEEEGEEDDEGLVVTMEFRRHDTDTGATTVLAEPGRDAFWPATWPLEPVTEPPGGA
ncbi:hypothetical protein [Nonomuraea sp. NPDC003727]